MAGRVTMEEIRALAERIGSEFNPEKVILFGSYAYGVPHEWSDVDLLVVMPFEGKALHKAVELRVAVRPPFPLDLLLRHPDEVEERYRLGDPIIREAVDHGVTLFRRAA